MGFKGVQWGSQGKEGLQKEYQKGFNGFLRGSKGFVGIRRGSKEFAGLQRVLKGVSEGF